jgi:NADH-quinone oxidoreductase subunit C/D
MKSEVRLTDTVVEQIRRRYPESVTALQETRDEIPTLWISETDVEKILCFLKEEVDKPFSMLFDLTAVDERLRKNRTGQPESDFTVVYHLLSFGRNEDIRIKVPLKGETPSCRSIVDIWPCANWYEREIWDMFGITFNGHPHLKRILMPPTWNGHPLRKEHPARATEFEPFALPDEKHDAEHEALRFSPEEWGMKRESEDSDFLFLNLGPQHPGTHGILRLILQLDGEEVVDAVPDIGYHHRGAEKMAERQTWHTYIPYTDRIDYLGGLMNNLPYVLAVERLAGIKVPDRVQVIRVMMVELCRIMSHLVWYGTFAQDVGSMSPVFYTFNDRERVFDIIEAVCGGRMHPMWFRIGGVAQDLPRGWDSMIRDFIAYFTKKLREYDRIVMKNRILKMRTRGVGCMTINQAVEWGVTGPNLRSCGLEWDLRKKRPYSGYEQFDFEIPTALNGDCYDRAAVRVEEMRQSLKILGQCVDGMPPGPYRSDHPLATPPRKEKTMEDIETLITHFLGVSWGPVIPAGEAYFGVEATKGMNGYYLISDGENHAYRARIRTPSFPHMQVVPVISRGLLVSDIIAILGSIDYVLADVDR